MNKPSFESVPLETGLHWPAGGGWRYEEKMDGCFHVRQFPAGTVVGELMRDGTFYAFDVLNYEGQDTRSLPLSERLAILNGMNLWRPRSYTGPSGGAFLAAVLARGGEGVVRKRLDQPYGTPWEKCKRSQVYYCRVQDLDPFRGSVMLADRDTGERRGKLALHSKFEQVRVGSVLKVEAFGLTAKGLLREARLDRDAPGSWLVSPRNGG
jgi:ATP-dependent DNA ligase